ncbi:hypothetical protein [Streptomyces netropsis]|uniref:Uncharacterized protein n=1 Tax=Streptomyces netropsis TaxID=55404 RepID=A0A7W7LFD9_STRNE|nr:hypothetical protein [Streptomyces netropsis]MBB4889119.1 hypothetical protein [Streptomyces netropsis]
MSARPNGGHHAAAAPRLLLNAQAFGFGPAAAMSVLAAELAPVCERLTYLGSGHTLDLQGEPPYDTVHDTTGRSTDELRALLGDLAPQYDLFVTAMDFEMAELARDTGLDVAVYDALTWYWPAIPEVAREAALYLAQDFFGVRERLAADPALRGRAVIVPPVIARGRAWRPGRHVLVNLGGLHNPCWPPDDAVTYARLMLDAVRASLPADRSVIVATSRTIAAGLDDPDVGTYDHATMLDLMSTAAYACMTSGLGNIYDAAVTGVPTLWLPAANDSQPEQVRLLCRHGYCDACLDWADVGRPVDYRPPTPVVSQAISRVVREVSGEPRLRARLAHRLTELTDGLGVTAGRARALTDHFGQGGTRKAAEAVLGWFERRACPVDRG